MVYFIVETPYEKCFDLFFKDELGYPNFYRMTELLSHHEGYQDLVLIAPSPALKSNISDIFTQKVDKLGVKYHAFGQNLQTAFVFHTNGMVQTEPGFKEALTHALNEFIQQK